MSPSLAEIEALTKTYAEARGSLGSLLSALNADLERVKQKYLPGIKAAVAKTKDAEGWLKGAVEQTPQLFVKPRTYSFHGIKVGYQKGKGGIAWDDPDHVVQLILRHLPDQADVLIQTTRRPVKKALEQLTVAELKKIGCTVVESGDEIVLKATDGEVEKMVNALLKETAAEDEAAA